jgi:hypothetical protein
MVPTGRTAEQHNNGARKIRDFMLIPHSPDATIHERHDRVHAGCASTWSHVGNVFDCQTVSSVLRGRTTGGAAPF